MLSPEIRPQVEQYIERYQQVPDQPEIWGCMDLRRPAENDNIVGGSLHFKIPGAASGLGDILGFAMELQSPGSFTKENMPPHILGNIASKILAESGVIIVNHWDCKKEEHAQAIGAGLATPNQRIFENTRAIKPDVDEQAYHNVVWAAERFTANNLYASGSIIREDMTNQADGRHPVDYIHLKNSSNGARAMVVTWEPDAAFNIARADASGDNCFAVTPGSFADRIVKHIRPHIPIDYDAANTAFAAVTAATYEKLNPVGQPELPIVVHGLAA